MELAVFLVTALIAIIGGVGMLLDANAVHSALFLLLNFFAIAILFLLLQSPFLFVIQITVYAGAIMVLFLFVVMLLGAERVEDRPDKLAWQRLLALGLGAVLLLQALLVAFLSAPDESPAQMAEAEALSSPEAIGASLFLDYLLPFELTGVLLLVAIVGVVVLQQRTRLLQQGKVPEGIE